MSITSTMRRTALLLAAGVIPFSLSCAKEEDCPATPCPTAHFKSRLLSGAATFASENRGQATFRVGEGCDTEFSYTLPKEERIYGDIHVLKCTSGGGITVVLNSVVDARFLSVGKHTWPAESAGLKVFGPSQLCSAPFTAGTVTVDVTQEEGHVVSYPQLVSSDYLRRYAVHIESSGNPTGCGAVSVVADFEVEQAAGDVAADPDSLCYCL